MASEYPECERLAEASKVTQPIGEFLDWLGSQGIHLMTWREDLTDSRVTDAVCWKRKNDWRKGTDLKLGCNPQAGDVIRSDVRGTAHCMHWQDPEREAGGDARAGICCHCRQGQHYEVTGLKAWVGDPRSYEQLLADFMEIDLKKVDAERRQILADLQSANEPAPVDGEGSDVD